MGGKNATTPPSLELFMKFLKNPKDTDLTTDQFNQILRMHGFEGKSSMEEKDKKEILEALSSIDVMVPSRSTLTENITPAFLPPDESSVQAVETIGWKPKFSTYFSHEKLIEELNSFGRIGWNQKLRDSVADEKIFRDSASVADTTLLTPPGSSCASHVFSGTFIMAMLFDDGVFCATESKLASFSYELNPFIIMERGEGMVHNGKYIFLPGVTMMYSGHVNQIVVLARELKDRLSKYLTKYGIPMDVQAVAKLTAKFLNSHCDAQHELLLECIFVGLSFLGKVTMVGVRKAKDFEIVLDESVIMMGSGSAHIEPLQLPKHSEIVEGDAHFICKTTTAKAISLDPQFCGGKTWYLKISTSANTVVGPISDDL